MCFKDRHYYVNKIKDFFGMVISAMLFAMLFMFMMYMA